VSPRATAIRNAAPDLGAVRRDRFARDNFESRYISSGRPLLRNLVWASVAATTLRQLPTQPHDGRQHCAFMTHNSRPRSRRASSIGPIMAMKMTRLPSGPLACVYSISEAESGNEQQPATYRAHSGSLEAEGESEEDALAALDELVRRASVPPECSGCFEVRASVRRCVAEPAPARRTGRS
jgi:hypothetical protein